MCGQLAAKCPEIKGAALLMPCDIGRLPQIKEEDPAAAGVSGSFASIAITVPPARRASARGLFLSFDAFDACDGCPPGRS